MKDERIVAGLDAGHVNAKAVIMKGREILGYGSSPTAFDVVGAALSALNDAMNKAGVTSGGVSAMVGTGIYRQVLKDRVPEMTETVPEYQADAKGAFFLNKNSRTVIDIGGNVHKAMHYDETGELLDVIQNDKCADGLGIFYTNIAKRLGLGEQELSELALKSTRNASVAIQCGLCAESEALDLMCQGVDTADIANAVVKFVGERVAAMSTYLPLTEEIVAVGGLAKSRVLIGHLSSLLKKDLKFVDVPEYVGAIGAVLSYGGGK
jgi:predicted CoA-substrate-specific enzyme activase